MISLDIAEILPQFPTYRVALVVAANLTIEQERPPALVDYIASVEADCRARYRRTGAGRHSRSAALAAGIQSVWRQEDELSLLGRAACFGV